MSPRPPDFLLFDSALLWQASEGESICTATEIDWSIDVPTSDSAASIASCQYCLDNLATRITKGRPTYARNIRLDSGSCPRQSRDRRKTPREINRISRLMKSSGLREIYLLCYSNSLDLLLRDKSRALVRIGCMVTSAVDTFFVCRTWHF